MVAEILNRVSWFMPDGLETVKVFRGEELVPLTKKEWKTRVHPNGAWILVMEFDERASDDAEKSEEYGYFTRTEEFEATATLRDVCERIHGGIRYGFFEGFIVMQNVGNRACFELCWGT